MNSISGKEADSADDFEKLSQDGCECPTRSAAEWCACLDARSLSDDTWQRLSYSITRYAYGVLRAWILSGEIVSRVRNITSNTFPWYSSSIDFDAAGELAGLTIATALRQFRNVALKAGRWKPRQGANLKTFFVGQCLLRFACEYRRWLREDHTNAPVYHRGLDELHDLRDSAVDRNPEAITILRMSCDSALAGLPSQRVRLVFLLRSVGYTNGDIANRLNTSTKAIEMVLYRFRSGRCELGEVTCGDAFPSRSRTPIPKYRGDRDG